MLRKKNNTSKKKCQCPVFRLSLFGVFFLLLLFYHYRCASIDDVRKTAEICVDYSFKTFPEQRKSFSMVLNMEV